MRLHPVGACGGRPGLCDRALRCCHRQHARCGTVRCVPPPLPARPGRRRSTAAPPRRAGQWPRSRGLYSAQRLPRPALAPVLAPEGWAVLQDGVDLPPLAVGRAFHPELVLPRVLHNKIAAAQTAVEAFDADGATPPPADLSRRILNSVGVKSIAIVTPAGRRGARPSRLLA